MKSFIFKKILNGLMFLVTLFGLFCFISCAADAGSGSGGGNTDKLVLDFNGGKMYNHKSATFTVEEITPYVGKTIDEAFKSLGIDTAFIKKEGFYLQGWTLKKNAEICVQNLPSYGTLYAKWGTDPLGGKDNSDEQDKTDDPIIPNDPAFDPDTPNPQPIVVVFDFDGGTHDGKLLFSLDFDYQLMQKYRGKPINDFLAHYDFDKSKMQKKGYVFNGWTLSQDGEDYVTIMPYSGNKKYWAKWIPENPSKPSDPSNPTPKPLYEYSVDNTQITFTFVPSDFGFDWDIKENHKVQLMADCSKWAYDENYLMLKDKDGNYVITVNNTIDVYLGFKNWPGFKFCIFDEDDGIWVGPNEYIISLPSDKIITGVNIDDPNFKIEVVDLNRDFFKLFENGDVVGDFSVKKGELDDGSIGWVYDETLGLDLTYEGEGVYTTTFTYRDYMNGWSGGNGKCSFKIRTIADSWVSSYGPSPSEKLTVDGEEVLCDSFQAGNFSVNLLNGVEYKITVRCALDGNVYVKIIAVGPEFYATADEIELDLTKGEIPSVILYSDYYDRLEVVGAYIEETEDYLEKFNLIEKSSTKKSVKVKLNDFLDNVSEVGEYNVVLYVACPDVIKGIYEVPVTVYVTSSVVAPSIETDLPSTAFVRDILSVVAKVTSGEINYQWYKDGIAIPGATTTSYEITEKGSYYVKVSNVLDSSKFVYSTTTIATTLFSITEQPTDLVIADLSKNSSQFLTASAFVYEGETISAQWFKDGVAVSSIENATTSITSTYKPTEFGMYMCKFISEEETLTTYVVEVTEAPISQGLVIEGITEGIPVNLEEEIIITPKSDVPCTYTYQWWAKGETSSSTREIEGATSNTYKLTYDFEYGIFCVVTFTSMQTGATIKRETATARYAH